MGRLLLGLSALVVVVALYGVAVEPRMIDSEEWNVSIEHLPEAWDGRAFAVIADLQVGMWLANTATITGVIDRIVDQEPSFVVIAGDFLYHPLGEEDRSSNKTAYTAEEVHAAVARITDVVDLLRPLTEHDIPTYAVLGNHDYGMRSRSVARLDWVADDLTDALEKIGVHVLQNEAVALQPPHRGASSDPLYLVGIGSHYAGYADPAAALQRVPPGAPRVIVMHHPESFALIPAGAAPLAIAGHTHGGQIGLPGLPDWSWMSLIHDDEVHADGWIDGYGAPGNRLCVNRGIGFSVVPVRIGAVPEVTVIRMQRTVDGAL